MVSEERSSTATSPEATPPEKERPSSVSAWDIPSAIVVGETFRMKVGVKRADDDEGADGEFGVYDHEGAAVATGTISGDIWPGTTGLYFSEVEVAAPDAEGLYTWSVKHAGESVSFGMRVVNHPDYLVRVETIDRADQTPLTGARIVMHPYRAETDERGIAELRVAKGTYKLFVSQTRYITVGLPIEVNADVATRAELDVEPVLERN